MTEYELNKVNQGTMRVLLINKHKDPWGKKRFMERIMEGLLNGEETRTKALSQK